MTPTQVRLGPAADVTPGTARCFEVDGCPAVAVFNLAGSFYATADRCPHQRASLSEGTIEGDEVICPLHFQIFHVPTGQAVEGITNQPLEIHTVRVRGGDLYVELP